MQAEEAIVPEGRRVTSTVMDRKEAFCWRRWAGSGSRGQEGEKKEEEGDDETNISNR